MKERILNNLSLKILSAVCAIVMWIIIVNIYNPSTSVTVSGVTVQLINAEALAAKEYAYEVIDGSKISVYISGPRSIVTDIKANDIIATADLSNVTVFSDYVDINVRVVKDGAIVSNIEVAPRTTAIRLKIENRVAKTFSVEADITGTPAEGYVAANSQISPSSIKITGNSSLVDSIASVRASYDVSGATMNISDSAPIKLYDSSDTEIVDERLELSKTSVDIKVNVYMTKTIPITYHSRGTPAEGYRLSGIEAASQVVIAGTEEELRDINSIDVPDSAIDVTGLTEDRIYHIRLTSYLPNSVIIMSDGVINATARIYAVAEKEISIPVTGIILDSLPAGYTISFGDITTVNVTVTGEAGAIAPLNAVNIMPSINLSGISEGINNLPIRFTLPANCQMKQNYTINVDADNISG